MDPHDAGGYPRATAIPPALGRAGVIDGTLVPTFTRICGYRNRMVHFYHAVSDHELFRMCTEHSSDIEQILSALLSWIAEHPDTQ